MLFVVAMLAVAPFLAAPGTANAQLAVTDPNSAITATNTFIIANNTTKDTVDKSLTDVLIEGAVVSVVAGVNYIATQMAYQLAVSLSGDCPGQGSCWDTKRWGDALSQAALGAVGESIGTLSENLGLGDRLCYPPGLALQIQLGLLDEYQPPKPKCDFNRIVQSYEDFANSFTGNALLNQLKPTLGPGNTPISTQLQLFDAIQANARTAEINYAYERLADAMAGGGFSSIKDPDSGRVLAPAAATEAEFDKMYKLREEKPQEYTTAFGAGQIASRAATTIVANVVQVFTQTLVSRLWNSFVRGLITAEEAISLQPDFIFNPDAFITNPGRATAERALTRVITPPPREIGTVDPILEFSVCPPNNRGPSNCVIDAQFANAIRVADGTPFTVRDAMEQGLLHADWPFVSEDDLARNQDPFCYTYAYCESNLKKLRAARVLPVGWEIVASMAKPGGGLIRLSDAVNNFSVCNDKGQRDDSHPFCNLINPDWVLKAPPMQCRAEVPGPFLVSSETSSRAEVCVDKRTCLAQDDRGNCIGGWGYCQREKDVWRFDADSCPAQFNSCRTFTNEITGTASYLLNTVDFGVCNADNAGCQQYALEKNAVMCTTSTCSPAAGASSCFFGCTITPGSTNCSAGSQATCQMATVCQDPNGCDVGCQVGSGQQGCTSIVGNELDQSDDWRNAPSRFFTGSTKTCSATDDGCSALIALGSGQSLNLIPDGNMEELEDADRDGELDSPRGWMLPAGKVPANRTGFITEDSSLVIDGSRSMLISQSSSAAGSCALSSACTKPDGCSCEEGGFGCRVAEGETQCTYASAAAVVTVPVTGGRSYTVSAVFKNSVPGHGASGALGVMFRKADGNPVILGDRNEKIATAATFSERISTYQSYFDGNESANPCKVVSDGYGLVKLDFTTLVGYPANGSGGVNELRAACTFTLPFEDVAYAEVHVMRNAGYMFDTMVVDNLQLEAGPLTPFHSGYNSSAKVNVKVAPEYLGCTGEPTDREECGNYAAVCREDEIGCEGYSPANGDPMVPGIIGPGDLCPAQCVGYDTFFQAPTDFDLPTEPDYFIPSTARQCSSADVGCTAFTNIETEGIENFSKIRICQKPEASDSLTYYSWEGSDTSGFQLRVWTLKGTEDPISGVGTAGATDAADICVDASCSAGNAGRAPCVKLDPVDPNICIDNPASAANRKGFCTRADIDAGDLDCREFYDSDGNRHYRRLSHTIIATADCSAYRISESSLEECRLFNGTWDSGRSDCVYSFAPSASTSCSAAVAGCRAYKGNASTNVRSVFLSDFENGLDEWANGTSSPDAATVGGHSMKLATGSSGTTRPLNGQVRAGRTYSLSFWARGAGSLHIGLVDGPGTAYCTLDSVNDCEEGGGCTCVSDEGFSCTVAKGEKACSVSAWNGADTSIDPDSELPAPFAYDDGGTTDLGSSYAPAVELSGEWQEYSLGPIEVTEANFGPDFVPVNLKVVRTSSTGEVYVDNVLLKEVQDSISVVKDSWVTPYACDSTPAGVFSPQEMLGCKAYSDTKGADHTLRSFSRICREQAISCQAYSDTGNTPDWTGYKTYNAVCSMTCTAATANGQPNCPCDYSPSLPVLYGDGGVSGLFGDSGLQLQGRNTLTDVCRVPIGGTECRFTLDGMIARGASHIDTVVTPADKTVHLAVKTKDVCLASALGCSVVGQPTPAYERECRSSTVCSADSCTCTDPESGLQCEIPTGSNKCVVSLEESVIGQWTAKAFIDDPAKYDTNLCLEEAVGCQAYSSPEGAYYFKDPGNRVCEWKENVSINGERRSGWFRKSDAGVLFACNPELLQYGSTYLIAKNGDATCTLPQNEVCADPDGCSCNAANGSLICLVANGRSSCGYQGWTATCPATYDRCEEFLDPSDRSIEHPDGRPYYYIQNQKFDTDTCSGTASRQQSCVLLRKTSDTHLTFQSAATYLRSEEENGTKVAPINCDTSNPNARCLRRCVSIPTGRCSLDPDIECTSTDNATGHGCPSGAGVCVGDRAFTSACTKTDDSECQTGIGETCELPGSAYSELTGNDSNIIVKVRRDRECAAWLECSQQQEVFDERLGRWTSVCMDFGLCTAKERNGDNFSCANFVDVPPEILTVEDYAARDTSWRGQEYSGYSLVDRYQAQFIEPVNISQGKCVNVVGGGTVLDQNGKKVFCARPDACGANQRCEPVGGVCVGGDRTNKGCEENADCTGGGICSKNELATTTYGVPLSLCDAGARAGRACASNDECPGSVCATSCLANDLCPTDVTGQPGTCINDRCYYSFSGGALDPADPLAGPACRGYPEETAPYVSTILDLGDPTQAFDSKGNAVRFKAAFQGANTCVEGNDCECSYAKVEYGKGGSVMYYSADNPSSPWPNYDGTKLPLPGVPPGLCSGGPNSGGWCNPADSASDTCVKAEGGTCAARTSQTVARGWAGFCVDPDRSMTVNGMTNEYGCNLWLPVDQLSGLSDGWNYYPEAGFVSDQPELLYCQVAAGRNQTGPGFVAGHPNEVLVADGNGSYLNQATETGTGFEDGSQTTHDVADIRSASAYQGVVDKSQVVGFRVDLRIRGDGSPTGTSSFFVPAPDDPNGDWMAAIDWAGDDEDTIGPPTGQLIGTSKPTGGPKNFPGGNDAASSYCIDTLTAGSKNLSKFEDYTENSSDSANAFRRCFGIELLWDGSGNLSQIQSVAIHGQDADSSYEPEFYADIFAVLAERCVEVAQTYGYGNDWGTSIGWTDRLWSGGNDVSPPFGWPFDKDHFSSRQWPDPFTSQSTDMTPYGRIPISTSSSLALAPSAGGTGVLTIGETEGGSKVTGLKVVRDGILTDQQHNYWFTTTPQVISGIPFACRGECGIPGSSTYLGPTVQNKGTTARDIGARNIGEFFATAWRLWSADTTGSVFTTALGTNVADRAYVLQSSNPSALAWDQREFHLSEGHAPRIVAPITTPGSCSAEGVCAEGPEGGITINGTTGSLFFSGGSGRAVISFYAYADPNRMPIRRKIVDFGDGQVSNTDGLYKNRRGLKVDNLTGELTPICDSSDFGHSPQACDPHYFQETRTYTCSQAYANTLPACSNANRTYPCNRDGICVYKPRVQVMDNWGVCNGLCPGGTQNSGLCFNKTLDVDAVSNGSTDECDLLQTNRGYDISDRPWTEFNGEINVCPGNCPGRY